MPEVTEQSLGPRGGNLENPLQHPERRRSDFNGAKETLHRFSPGDDSARCGLKNEQPWHRMAAFMLLAKRTNSEIAAAAGVTPEAVSLVRGQRWFQQLLGTLANDAGEEVIAVIQGEALASVERIIAIRDHAESDRVALSAATTLLEHATGKPVQKTVTSSRPSHLTPQEEFTQIQEELAAMQKPTV